MAVREIGAKLVLGGEAEFNSAMKSVNSNLKTLKSDMNACTVEFANNANSTEALTAKQRILDEVAGQHGAKVEALRARYEHLVETQGEESAAADKAKQALNSATVAQIKAAQAADQNREALNAAASGVEEFKASVAGVNEKIKSLESDMSVCTAAFDSNARASTALAEKQRILDNIAAQHGEKVAALRNRYAQLVSTQGAESDAADQAKQALNAATVAQLKAVQAADKNREALAAAKKEESLFTKASEVAGRAAGVAAKGLEGLAKVGGKVVLTTARKSVEGLGAATKALGSGIATMAKGTAVATTALAGAGVAALGLMTSYAKEAAESAKAAKEAGETLTPTQQTWLEFSSQLDTLDASAASAKAALGSVLLPVLSDMSTVGAEYLQGFASEMEAAAGDTKKQGKIISDYVAKGAQLIKEKLPEYAATGKALLQGLGEGMAENGPEILDIGIDLIMDLLDGLISAAPQVGDAAVTIAGKLLDTLTERGPDMLARGMDMVVQLITGLAQAAPKLVPQAINLVTQLLTTLLEHAPDLLLAGLQLILGIISGLAEGLGNIKSSAGEIIQTVKDAFSEKAGEIKDVGMQIVTGIWNGISSGYDWIIGKLKEWLDDVVQFIKDKLGIHSPSTVMADQVGAWMPRGIWAGFAREMPAVNRMIANSINTTFDLPGVRTGRASFGIGGYAVGGKTVNLYFSAKQITQADISMIVDTVNRELGGAIA